MIGDAFDKTESVYVAGDAFVRRWLYKDGPLLLSSRGWGDRVAEAFEGLGALGDQTDNSGV
jgi:hypothetical protein